jgi:hypothetical protein
MAYLSITVVIFLFWTIIKGNVTVYFDHVYSGNYKLKVGECKNSRFSCFHTIHESDLGFVETHLNNINVTKMNISISTTPTEIG